MCVFSLQPNCSNVDAKLNMLVEKETAKNQSFFFEQSAFYQHGLIGVEESTAEDDEKQKNRLLRE